jgi:hypothetical protein
VDYVGTWYVYHMVWTSCYLFFVYQETETIYTHHQKTVIVDTDAGHFRRKITAFVGGLDLCKGRYDTPQHPLFRTLQTVHKDDFRNPNFAVISQLMFLGAIWYISYKLLQRWQSLNYLARLMHTHMIYLAYHCVVSCKMLHKSVTKRC